MYELLCSVAIGSWIKFWEFDVLRRYKNLRYYQVLVYRLAAPYLPPGDNWFRGTCMPLNG